MNIMHSSRSDKWFTPVHIIAKVQQVLGHVDCDPASERDANLRIGATRYLTADGELPESVWLLNEGTVYLNPPGNKIGNKSLTGLFWKRMMQERDSGLLTHGIFMCFSIEALQSTQKPGQQSIGEFPFCVPSKRIKFDDPNDHSKQSPSHSNAIVYVPGMMDKRDLFAEVFRSEGVVIGV